MFKLKFNQLIIKLWKYLSVHSNLKRYWLEQKWKKER